MSSYLLTTLLSKPEPPLITQLRSSPHNLTVLPPTAREAKPFNHRLLYTPAAIVIPRNISEIQEALRIARENGINVSARCGGHSYAAHGIGGEDGVLVVDMKMFADFEVDIETGVASVGGGLRLGEVAWKLWENGERAMPHGVCPAVGIAGHSLLGGFGHASRMWGLAVDSILELQCVLADGSVITASQTENKELYWALRGAGPSFAIVTTFKMITYPAPPKNIVYNYRYRSLDPEVNTKAFMALHEFGRFGAVDERLGLGIVIFPTGEFWLRGVFFGELDEFHRIMDPFTEKLDVAFGYAIEKKEIMELGWPRKLEEVAEGRRLRIDLKIEAEGGYWERDTFYAKSLAEPVENVITEDAVRSLFDYFATEGQNTTCEWFLIFNLYGGPPGSSKINNPSIPSTTSSYSHRNVFHTWQFYAHTKSFDPEPGNTELLVPFLNGAVEALMKKMENKDGWGAYPGYIDAELKGLEAGSHIMVRTRNG
ncbi:hypothetical protein RUND412_002476 [Rhizina undulata]